MSEISEMTEMAGLNRFRKGEHLIDAAHEALDPFDVPLIFDVWRDKYAWEDEKSPQDMFERVADGIYAEEIKANPAVGKFHRKEAVKALIHGLLMPGGRILAGAGTSKRVTLMNCYVNGTVGDSMEGIHKALGNVMMTLQQGGGIGTDFSTLRPKQALLKRTGKGSAASGPIPFMDQWDATSKTIKSAGDRRGAMMGTICDTHPDLPDFIVAKQEKGKWEQFNVSVLVSDAFMKAVELDDEWYLYFNVPPVTARGPDLKSLDFDDPDGTRQYVYSKWRARELWDLITRNTYEWSEPGVIFIDRVNDLNNLQYCEYISCTNPCVTGDTLILTQAGYKPIEGLVGHSIKIWNGYSWADVTPYQTGVQDLMGITFSNGMQLKVTPDHKFFIAGKKVSAMELNVGDKLDWAQMPVVDLPPMGGYDYTQGFYAGDGSEGSNHSKLYAPKYSVRSRLYGTFSEEHSDRGTYVNWYHGEMLPKDSVPVNGSIDECVQWLAGWLDADGSILKKGASYVIEGSSKSMEFLQQVVLMLTRLGCNPRMWAASDGGQKIVNGVSGEFSNTFRLMLNMADVWNLKSLGMDCSRLDLSVFRKPAGIARVGQRIVSITDLPDVAMTYCFTEPERECGVFNGVLTGQCGEQPLPPHGTCNLSAINLARIVRKPFTPQAEVDFDLLEWVVGVAVRFLDNVIDVTRYPLPEQAEEEYNKRRLGLGISGLADCLAQLGITYGKNARARQMVTRIMRTIAVEAYRASAMLAHERGAFPLFDKEEFTKAPMVQKMPEDVREMIYELGIRNGLLLTIAPTGTTSLIAGNVSSGLECTFLHEASRRVFGKDNVWKEYGVVPGYGFRLYKAIHGECEVEDLPSYMVTSKDLSIDDHLTIQAVCQEWIDASVSKTINLPEDIDFEEFKDVYWKAYNWGCKGCTTYRPSDVRGAVLAAPKKGDNDQQNNTSQSIIPSRPDCLDGSTYKIKWPSWSSAVYVTINHDEAGRPFEVFIQSKDARHQEWITALTVMMSSNMRRGDYLFIPTELKQLHSMHDSSWANGKFYGSLVHRIGDVLEQHFIRMGLIDNPAEAKAKADTKEISTKMLDIMRGEVCPNCHAPSLLKAEGCWECQNCDYTKCG